jgi:hypothetical protein
LPSVKRLTACERTFRPSSSAPVLILTDEPHTDPQHSYAIFAAALEKGGVCAMNMKVPPVSWPVVSEQQVGANIIRIGVQAEAWWYEILPGTNVAYASKIKLTGSIGRPDYLEPSRGARCVYELSSGFESTPHLFASFARVPVAAAAAADAATANVIPAANVHLQALRERGVRGERDRSFCARPETGLARAQAGGRAG